MTTQQMEFFLKLAEELNYTRVAQMFFITQPTLSKQITNLENELKTKLFTRDRNSVCLTPEGKRFYGRAKPLFTEVLDLIHDIQSDEAKRDTIYIGVQDDQLMNEDLMQAVCDIQKAWPELSVSIQKTQLEELVDGLSSGQYDVVNLVRGPLPHVLFPEETRYRFIPLKSEDMYLFYSRYLMDLPDEITKKTLAEVLSKYDLLIPYYRKDMNAEKARGTFLNIMSDNDITDAGIHVVMSGSPISLQPQLTLGFGVSVSNQTSTLTETPDLKSARILKTEKAFMKGLLVKKQVEDKYVNMLVNQAVQSAVNS